MNVEKTFLTILDRLKNPWVQTGVTPFLVIIFILLFQPFDYNLLAPSIKIHILSIVAIGSFIFSIICNVATRGFGDKVKTVTYLLLVVAFSQLLYLYTIVTRLNNFSWEGCIIYLFSTSLIAFIPAIFYYIIALVATGGHKVLNTEKETITLGEYTLPLTAIVLIKAEDNYISIYRKDKNPLLVRGTLSDAASKAVDTTLFKVHRSFLVNLNAVQGISGNANGYKLRLNQYDGLVPVARSRGSLLKKEIKRVRA